jgi:hypothetical protein
VPSTELPNLIQEPDTDLKVILSENTKTGRSLNFPIYGHCHPSEVCEAVCYAKPVFKLYKSSLPKAEKVSKYFEGTDMSRVIKEINNWKRPSVRISATGDLFPKQAENLIYVAKKCPNTMLWGMTRKVQIAEIINGARLPNLCMLVSVDLSTARRASGMKLINYIERGGYYCYLRLSDQKIASLKKGSPVRKPLNLGVVSDTFEQSDVKNPQLVSIFPVHTGANVGAIPVTRKDCPAIRDKVDGCWQCGKCWLWAPWITGRYLGNAKESYYDIGLDPSLPKPKNW